MKNETIIAVEKVDPRKIQQALPYNFGKTAEQSDYFVLGLRRLKSGKYSIVRWYRLSTDKPEKVPEWQREAARKITEEHNNGGLTSLYLIGTVSPEPAALEPEIVNAFEMGFRCCEKGMNLDAALAELRKLFV